MRNVANLNMMKRTHCSWNPVTGCTKRSAGCDHCYAEVMALRFQKTGMAKYANGFRLTLHHDVVEQPLHWRKPRSVFTCSMADLFHEDIPFEFLQKMFSVIERSERHHFLALTKRSNRLAELAPRLPWPKNLWMGVTVERADYLYRIDNLRAVPAALRFLSLEPLLGSLSDINLDGIGWVFVGGEAGSGFRPMKKEWVLEIQQRCREAGVPFFFKQWGGEGRYRFRDLLDGQVYQEYPPEAFYEPPQLDMFGE